MKKITQDLDPEDYKIKDNQFYIELNEYFEKLMPTTPSFDRKEFKYIKDEGFSYSLSPEELEFYKEDYMVFSELVNISNSEIIRENFLLNDMLKNNVQIGYQEKDILEVIYSTNVKKITVIEGGIGWGKTTLLRYSFCFLLRYLKNKKNVIPFYFDLDKNGWNTISSDTEIESKFIALELIPQIRKNCKISILDEEFWSFVKEHSDIDAAKLSDYEEAQLALNKPQKTVDNIYLRRQELIDSSNDINLLRLKYYKQVVGAMPILIIDNIDPLNNKTISGILKTVYGLTEKYFVKAILPIRPTTLHEIRHNKDSLFKILKNTDIKLAKPVPRDIIGFNLQKLSNSFNKISRPVEINNITFTNINVLKITNVFFQLLQNPDVQLLFDRLSKGNLRDWHSLLMTFFSSGYINDSFLYTNYMAGIYDGVEEETLPTHIPYKAIITGNYETYFSSSIASREIYQICNLLSNKSYFPNNLLIRVHLLLAVRQRNRISISELREKYFTLFGTCIEGFDSAIRMLINYGILKNKLFHQLNDISEVKGLTNVTYNTTLGDFYLFYLFRNTNYLLNMKDDIYFTNPTLSKIKSNLSLKKDQYSSSVKQLYVLINYIFEFEVSLIKSMQANSNPNEIDRFTLYRELFSPKYDSIFVSNIMINGIVDFYANWKNQPNNFNLLVNLKKEIKLTNKNLIKDYE